MKNLKKNIFLESKNYLLRCLSSKNSALVLRYVLDNKEFHRLAMPQREDKFYTEKHQKMILDEEEHLSMKLKMIRFYIFDHFGSEILGDIILSDIKTGYVASCSIGIKLHKDHTCKGIATETLHRTLEFAFFGLNIFRLEANIMPENLRSIALFKKLGFLQEGISRGYFFTDGKWQDHLRFSLLKNDFTQ